MRFIHKSFSFFIQDLRLRKKVIYSLLIFINVLMLATILPGDIPVITKWHSIKDFILLFRYEFFHVPIFIILLGTLSKSNDWILLRRYKSREELANHKIVFVVFLSIFLTLTVIIPGSLYTSIVKIIPNDWNYNALFLYEETTSEESSLFYFMYSYIILTSIIGLIFIVMQNLIKNDTLSAAIIISLVIWDRLNYSFAPTLFYKSEFISPLIWFLVLISILIILYNLVHFTMNNVNFYVRDDKL